MWKRSSSVGGVPLKPPVQKAFRKPAWSHALSPAGFGAIRIHQDRAGTGPGLPLEAEVMGVGRRACPWLDGWGTSCVLLTHQVLLGGVTSVRKVLCSFFFNLYFARSQLPKLTLRRLSQRRTGSLQTSSAFPSRSIYVALYICSVFHVALIFSKDHYSKRFHWVKSQRWFNETASYKLSTFWTTTHKTRLLLCHRWWNWGTGKLTVSGVPLQLTFWGGLRELGPLGLYSLASVLSIGPLLLNFPGPARVFFLLQPTYFTLLSMQSTAAFSELHWFLKFHWWEGKFSFW